jgi:4-hydroxybenzoate polyprenyltransferase
MTVMEMSGQRLRERLDLYERLMRLDKPIGILLLLWPTLWALWLSALGRPDWLVVGHLRARHGVDAFGPDA